MLVLVTSILRTSCIRSCAEIGLQDFTKGEWKGFVRSGMSEAQVLHIDTRFEQEHSNSAAGRKCLRKSGISS